MSEHAIAPSRRAVSPRPVAPNPSTHPAGATLNRSAHVSALVTRAAMLNGQVTQLSGRGQGKKDDGKKSNNKKQEKKKAQVEGKKKAKEKKLNKLADSVMAYGTTDKSKKEIKKTIVDNMNLKKSRAGHISADSSQKMNYGTKKLLRDFNEVKNKNAPSEGATRGSAPYFASGKSKKTPSAYRPDKSVAAENDKEEAVLEEEEDEDEDEEGEGFAEEGSDFEENKHDSSDDENEQGGGGMIGNSEPISV